MTETSKSSGVSAASSKGKSTSVSINESLLEKLIEKKKKKLKKQHFSNSEEAAIDDIIQKAFNRVIGKESYSPLKTADWISKMIDTLSEEFLNHGETRKFIIHCTICSKNSDLSICSANMCFWDSTRDSVYFTEWLSKTVFGSVYVFFITHRSSK